ncbi:MAG: hypothetical protein A2Y10_06645 [Planctomycetes bacterium GWF2_41_51]|nr:MAG: hypothetical protein A2Y10_06645 [Planctomycetes bacterium GWF2_41_51]HBG28145.1 hypothetical protein [Phycisphaerales bacterium]
MQEKKGFPTKEKAIEAWQTWKGHYCDLDPCLFREINSKIDWDYFKKLDLKTISIKDKEAFESSLQMLTNDSLVVPWPKLTHMQLKLIKDKHLDIKEIYALRLRWIHLFPNIERYRFIIYHFLKNNEIENAILNDLLLNEWNPILEKVDLPIFKENDLRGINLSGFEVDAEEFSGIQLRNVDLSFSELSVSRFQGANFYGSKFFGSNAWQINLSYSICCNSVFESSMFCQSKFYATDFSNSKLDKANFCGGKFDGANLNDCSAKGTFLKNASFDTLETYKDGIKSSREIQINNLEFNKDTNFEGVKLNATDKNIEPELKDFIHLQNSPKLKKSFFKRILNCIEMKPGVCGISFDMKRLFDK